MTVAIDLPQSTSPFHQEERDWSDRRTRNCPPIDLSPLGVTIRVEMPELIKTSSMSCRFYGPIVRDYVLFFH
jgi:hypothetical protein